MARLTTSSRRWLSPTAAPAAAAAAAVAASAADPAREGQRRRDHTDEGC